MVERLDSNAPRDERSWTPVEPLSEVSNVVDDVDPAPVFLIRDAATEVGVGTPAITGVSKSPQFSRRIVESIDASTAGSLLEM